VKWVQAVNEMGTGCD